MAQKSCKNCGTLTGPRTKVCFECGYSFITAYSSGIDESISENSISLDEEFHFTEKNRVCAFCETSYSYDNRIKDCHGNKVFIFKNGIYCSKYCLQSGSLLIADIAFKLQEGSSLSEKESDLLSCLKSRKEELEEFKITLQKFPAVKFKIKPDVKQVFIPRLPPKRDYIPSVDYVSDDEPSISFADLIEISDSVPSDEPAPVKEAFSFASLISKENNTPAKEVVTPVASKVTSFSSLLGESKPEGLISKPKIENEEQCLKALLEIKSDINYIGIGDINNLIPHCERTILARTIAMLDVERGKGYKGYVCQVTGKKRGKKYKLTEK